MPISARTNRPVDCSASAYDIYTNGFVAPYDRLLLRRLLWERRRAPAAAVGTLLDIGTGTARFLMAAALEPTLARLYFVGLDYFPDMVAQSRQNVWAAGLAERIAIVEADVHDLPFADAAFGNVISRSTVHHWADPVRALREIDRILAPGGTALVHDVRRDPCPAALAQFDADRAAAGLPRSNLSEKYTADELRRLIVQAGIGGQSVVFAPRSGPAALGLELRITKPLLVHPPAVLRIVS